GFPPHGLLPLTVPLSLRCRHARLRRTPHPAHRAGPPGSAQGLCRCARLAAATLRRRRRADRTEPGRRQPAGGPFQRTAAGRRPTGGRLGAARVRPQGEELRLSHVCVRALTRERGVARRIFEEARREAEETGLLLVLAADPTREIAQQLSTHLVLPLQSL